MSNLAYQTLPKKEYNKQPDKKVKVNKSYGVTQGEKVLVFFLLTLILLGCGLIVSNQATIYQANNEVQGLQKEIDQQIKINSSLEEQISGLKNPDRILKIATEQGLSIKQNNIELIQQ